MNVGHDAHHLTRAEVEQEFRRKSAVFTASCSTPPAFDRRYSSGNSNAPCSDRELLTHSKKVRTAPREVTRNGVQQAFLVAEVKNEKCVELGLVDFIFNLEPTAWKLFSIP